MKTAYDSEVSNIVVSNNLKRLTNQIFRLLPLNEENEDWVKPLETAIIEFAGLANLFPENEKMFTLLCKLEGLRAQQEEIDFLLFRRVIFECCSMAQDIEKEIH